MKIAIRADASEPMGTGHIMRCLTLADALKHRGASVQFISRSMPTHLQTMLIERGHAFTMTRPGMATESIDELAHSAWLGTSQAQDAAEAKHVLSDNPCDWLIVDHYSLDARWESSMRSVARHIAAIDDIADRRHDCDLLLDQNFQPEGEGRYAGKVPAHCELLIGPRYALLREEFRVRHAQAVARTGRVSRILVFFGGMDAQNCTGRALEALGHLDVSGLHVDVVVGTLHPQREYIEAGCRRLGFQCHVQTTRMAELMLGADLGIGAGGSAMWERCSLGLPTLTLCVAYNQARQVEDAAAGGLIYAPELDARWTEALSLHIRALIENPTLRHLISSNGLATVDGQGALRVASRLNSDAIELRPARVEDSHDLFEWRNHASIRAVSRSSEPIDWGTHERWLAAVLVAPNRSLLIGQRAGAPVGVVRFDLEGTEAEVSIYLVPGRSPAGEGRALLRGAERWLGAHHPQVSAIRAWVLGSNERSRRLFSAAGYAPESASYLKRLH